MTRRFEESAQEAVRVGNKADDLKRDNHRIKNLMEDMKREKVCEMQTPRTSGKKKKTKDNKKKSKRMKILACSNSMLALWTLSCRME